MRTAFVVLVTLVPMAACSDAFVTAPPTVTAAPAVVPRRGVIMADGVVVLQGDINPTDVEEIEVVKGPAAGTIYGTMTRCPAIIIRTTPPRSAALGMR